MASITIEPRNPLSVKPEELESFVSEVATSVPDGVDVTLSRGREMPPGMRAVTYWEPIVATLREIPDDVRGAIVALLLDRFIVWARARFRRKREDALGPDRRPKSLTILAEDGTVFITKVLRTPRGKLIDEDAALKPAPVRKRAKTSTKKMAKPPRKR